MQREFSEDQPELMDLPNQDESALQSDLENLAQINGRFGARRTLGKIFRNMVQGTSRFVLIDLACGYGDHGRTFLQHAQSLEHDATVIGVDFQFQTLRIARAATKPEQKMFYVQADARQLPFRTKESDFVFCSLALHHFAEKDALMVLGEMARIGHRGLACADLVRSRLAVLGIWLMTTFVIRDPMVRHDARLSVRRAFTTQELRTMAQSAGWPSFRQITYPFFQQAILAGHRP